MTLLLRLFRLTSLRVWAGAARSPFVLRGRGGQLIFLGDNLLVLSPAMGFICLMAWKNGVALVLARPKKQSLHWRFKFFHDDVDGQVLSIFGIWEP
jgi:hypothetical protein